MPPIALEQLPSGTEPLPNLNPPPFVRQLLDLEHALPNDGNTLLGNRFLCRGGGLLFVGSSGIGKSTAVIQMGICWAVGRPCFGISTHQPLRILYVQAENDEGDLCEMRDGVLAGLELAAEELALLELNFTCVLESTRTGREFVTDVLDPLLAEHRPDLLIIDPALSYIGGAVNEQDVVGGFLRNQLNPLMQKHACGVLIVHHTNKPNADKDSKSRVANDFAYAGSGSAEWANWARAVLVLQAKSDDGIRTLRIGKRFRLGWLDEEGKPVSWKGLRQSEFGQPLFYRELSAEENMERSEKVDPLTKILRAPNILPHPGQYVRKDILVSRITQAKLSGRDKTTKEILPALVDQGYLVEKGRPRSGKRNEVGYERTDKQVGFVSFASTSRVATETAVTAKMPS